jgi:hypothetical protein
VPARVLPRRSDYHIPADKQEHFELADALAALNLRMESVEAGDAALPGFEGFARQVAEFLSFKHLEVLPSLQMEVLVTAAGRRSMRSDHKTGRPAGLGPSLAPWAECGREGTQPAHSRQPGAKAGGA